MKPDEIDWPMLDRLVYSYIRRQRWQAHLQGASTVSQYADALKRGRKRGGYQGRSSTRPSANNNDVRHVSANQFLRELGQEP